MPDEVSISFTEDHVEKIRRGEKVTTMRTVKRGHVYVPGKVYPVHHSGVEDLAVRVTDMAVVMFGPDTFYPLDEPEHKQGSIPLETHLGLVYLSSSQGGSSNWKYSLADVEGFEDFEEMLAWFQGGNPWGAEYDLPQPFFLYRIKPVEKYIEGSTR